ncbi:MAG TPA: sialidase family protein [Thermoanaerobaculia bacterium]|nr:sialidase family protein [Thermoanaerobaculia bacterium]
MHRFVLPLRATLTLLFAAAALPLIATAQSGAGLDPSLLAGLRARSIGPAGMSGRVAAIAAVPGDPATVWVGASTGGVWKSVDGGVTFQPVFDDQPVAAIGALAIHGSNPDLVWVGTGEGNVRNSVSVGNGVYRSLDGGETWSHLGLDATERIHRIVLHPSDPEVALVCAMGRAWGENPERGVYRTGDGGTTWERVLYVDERTGCADLAVDPANPDKVIAALWQYRRTPDFFRSGGPGSGLYRSHDGGRTWIRSETTDGMPKGELGRIGVAFARSEPRIVYALVEAKESALLRSEDGGRSWRAVNTDSNVSPRPFYYADIRVDPERPNRVYRMHSSIDVSEDGGRTFQTLVGFIDLHPDHHALWIDPTDGRRMIAGNDGGVGLSHDRGSSWRFVRNLPLAQYYHVRVDNDLPYNVYGGLQDNGSWRGPSSVWEGGFGGGIRNLHWTMVAFGDGFDTAADPEDSSRGYAMSQGGNLSRWDLHAGGSKSIRPDGPDDEDLRFNWNAGFAQDPFDGSVIYYGSQYLHRSNDRGETWTIVSPDLTTDNEEWQLQRESGGLTLDVTAAENHTTILAVAPSAVEPGVIWVGTDDGRLQVTRDGGETWSSLEDRAPGVPAHTWIPHITPSAHRGDQAFVVFDNHRRSDWTPYAFRVSVYGDTWERIADGDDVWGYALKVEQDPVEEDLLFLGTEFGLWVSLDGGGRWFQWKHGVPTVSVMDMAIHQRDHDLVLGTHGRAIFVLDDLGPLRELSAAVLARPVHLFPIADAIQHRLGASPGELMPGAGEFRGENRPYGALIAFSLAADDLPHPDPKVRREEAAREREERAARGEEPAAETESQEADFPDRGGRGARRGGDGKQAKIEVLDTTGKVIRTFEPEVFRGVNRVAWDLRVDAFRRPGREGGGGFFGGGAGPEVMPGNYTVRVSYGGASAEGAVRVLPDPRLTITEADRRENWDTLQRAGRLVETVADAVSRIESVRADLDVISRKLREAEEAAKEEAAEGAREEAETGEEPAGEQGLEPRIAELREQLDVLEKELWNPPDSKGIQARDRAFDRVQQALGAVQSSWERPNATQLTRLRQADEHLRPILDRLNELLADEVAAVREAAREEGVDLLGGLEPVALDG